MVEPLNPDDKAAPKLSGSKWLGFAFAACFCFTLCNAALSEITSKVGPACIFYFASGGIITGLVYNMQQSV